MLLHKELFLLRIMTNLIFILYIINNFQIIQFLHGKKEVKFSSYCKKEPCKNYIIIIYPAEKFVILNHSSAHLTCLQK